MDDVLRKRVYFYTRFPRGQFELCISVQIHESSSVYY